ncbi:MAG: methyltransferase domain-containing protein [candidate division Zixibacteria bacterium]|nr:methyltransferase domain-containing protein [candidate division Zixibacteria bacterium]
MKDYLEHYRRDGDYFDYSANRAGNIGEVEKRRRQIIINAIPKTANKKPIIDIGSGSGELSRDLIATGFDVVPVDLSLKNLTGAASKGESDPVLTDAYRLSFLDNSFWGATLSSILEHCQHPEKVLSEAVRVVDEGCRVIVVVPYDERIVYHQCIHCNKPTPSHAHLHSFDQKKLKSLFELCGLRILKIKKFANKAMDLLRINRMLKLMPYSIWNIADSIANTVVQKPGYIMIVGIKVKR